MSRIFGKKKNNIHSKKNLPLNLLFECFTNERIQLAKKILVSKKKFLFGSTIKDRHLERRAIEETKKDIQVLITKEKPNLDNSEQRKQLINKIRQIIKSKKIEILKKTQSFTYSQWRILKKQYVKGRHFTTLKTDLHDKITIAKHVKAVRNAHNGKIVVRSKKPNLPQGKLNDIANFIIATTKNAETNGKTPIQITISSGSNKEIDFILTKISTNNNIVLIIQPALLARMPIEIKNKFINHTNNLNAANIATTHPLIFSQPHPKTITTNNLTSQTNISDNKFKKNLPTQPK